MGTLTELVKDRLLHKTTHQLILMGLDPAVRWWMQVEMNSFFMYLILFVGVIVPSFAYTAYPLTPVAMPAFIVLILVVVPSFNMFVSAFNFCFWCAACVARRVAALFLRALPSLAEHTRVYASALLARRCKDNSEDVVGGTVINMLMYLSFTPTMLLSQVAAIRDNSTANYIISLVLMIYPGNQLTFGISALYFTQFYAQVQEELTGKSPSVGEFFNLTISNPYALARTSSLRPSLTVPCACPCVQV